MAPSQRAPRVACALTLITVCALAALLVVLVQRDELARPLRGVLSGWLLSAGVALLFLHDFRPRRQEALRSTLWARRVHVLVGLLVMVLFGLHTRWRLPDGVLESSLWWAFIGCALTGVWALALRWRRLLVAGDEGGGGERSTWRYLHVPLGDLVVILGLVHALLALHTFAGAVW